jgi:hypothetical protein
MVEKQVEGVGREQIHLRARHGVARRIRETRRDLSQRGQVIVLRPESILLRLPDELEQDGEPFRRPEGPIAAFLVDRGQRISRDERFVANLEIPGRLKLLEELSESLGDSALDYLRLCRGRRTRRESEDGGEQASHGPSSSAVHDRRGRL